MPFNLRNFEEEAKAKMGVVECVSHKLIEPFQVLYEKKGKFCFFVVIILLSKDNSMILSLLVEIVSRHFARTNRKVIFFSFLLKIKNINFVFN